MPELPLLVLIAIKLVLKRALIALYATRVSCPVRDTLAFSENLDSHIGAIWFLIYHYNQSLLF